VKRSQSVARRGSGRHCASSVALLALIWVAPAQAECPAGAAEMLTEAQCQALLRDGEVYHTYKLDDGSKDTRGIAARLVAASPEAVWRVVTDNENFEQFICSVARSEFDPVSGINLQVVKVPFWLDVSYRIKIENSVVGSGADTVWRSAWTYVEGDLDTSEGSWTLRPDESGTLVLYEVRTDPGFGKRWVYSPGRAEAELRKLLADVASRVADPDYRCP
jgi:Polyketide cyclase / dehydrase and lipid transport